MIRNWFKSGTPWIWLNAGAVSIALVAVFGLLLLIMFRGMSHFWPANVESFHYVNDQQTMTVIAEVVESETVPSESVPGITSATGEVTRYLVKTGNRDILGSDFKWIYDQKLETREQPSEVMVLERIEWGNFYGYLNAVYENSSLISNDENKWSVFNLRLERALDIREQILDLEKGDIGAINYRLERLRLNKRSLQLDDEYTDDAANEIEQERTVLKAQYAELLKLTAKLYEDINRDSIRATIMDGREITIPLEKIVKVWQPNKMNVLDKLVFYFKSLWAFVTEDPREANTEGGIFPAIFGTVMMVMLMSVMVTPFGVVAAVYLREYAQQGAIIRVIRIAVNNLAGVPSIVYGVFGLGFFVYFLGGSIDALFYP